MGRGRAKAKQTKVARQLKYSSHGTDLERLQAELGSAADAEAGDADELDLDDEDYEVDDDDLDEDEASSRQA